MLEVTQSLEDVVQKAYPASFLVKAEINKLNLYHYSGHCYPDLVQKVGGKVVSQMRAIIWQRDYQRINQAFMQVLGEPLSEGIEVQVRARLQYSSLYGLSLVISDIDPLVSLGRMELDKRLCAERLRKEGLYDLNKGRTLTLIPQRIAVISASTSKGYSDFLSTLEQNPRHYSFSIRLFPSLLQGDNASRELRAALADIAAHADSYDCVCIIRGGGGDIGLNCYNDYALCRDIATFPLPVLTGIGHSTNSTIAEEISYQNFITPTALADFFLQRLCAFHDDLDTLNKRLQQCCTQILKEHGREIAFMQRGLKDSVRQMLRDRQWRLDAARQTLTESTQHRCRDHGRELDFLMRTLSARGGGIIAQHRGRLAQQRESLENMARGTLQRCHGSLEAIQQVVAANDPRRLLNLGYSITRHNGKVVTSYEEVGAGDELTTEVKYGTVLSVVKETENICPPLE